MIVEREVGRGRNKKLVKRIKRSVLEPLLKKCPNIQTLIIPDFVDGTDLLMFGELCPQLKTLDIDSHYLKGIEGLDFGQSYGHQLRELKFHSNRNRYLHSQLKKFLRFCSNVKRIDFPFEDVFLNDDKDFLPKLEVIEKVSFGGWELI